MCSSSHVLSVVVDSRPSDLERAPDDVIDDVSLLDDVTFKLCKQQQSDAYSASALCKSFANTLLTFFFMAPFPKSGYGVWRVL